MMNKVELLQDELNLINDIEIKEFTRQVIEIMPDYFFSIPASSSGKYHPEYALGEGGLLRHTKAAVRIAYALCKLNMFHMDNEKADIVISALILHDGWKQGKEATGVTLFEHPNLASQAIDEVFRGTKILPWEDYCNIRQCIESHMGQWNTSKDSDVVLFEPWSDIEELVHLCDYLASRKMLEFNFDVEIGK